MTRVALRGLAARRLRLALTALAVALGVTLIAGTYVFTDTINTAFDADLHDVLPAHRRGGDARQDEVRNQDADAAARRRAVLDKVRRRPASPTPRAGCSAPADWCSTRSGKRLGQRGADVHRVRDAARAYALVDVAPGRLARGAGRGRARQVDRRTTRRVPGGRQRSRSQGVSAQAAATGSSGSPASPGVDSLGGAGGDAHAARGAADHRQGRPVRRDRRDRASKGVRRAGGQARAAVRAACRATSTCAPAREEAASQSKDIRDNLGFLRDRAARLRRHLAVRRRLHHLQHVLDHRRAARARVRAAAHAWARRARRCMRSVLGRGPLPRGSSAR